MSRLHEWIKMYFKRNLSILSTIVDINISMRILRRALRYMCCRKNESDKLVHH